MSLENRGVPTVVVCTAPFQEPALLHARTLGRAGFQPIIIPHPLGGLDRQRVSQRANEVQDQVITALCSVL
jgi:hypothetical protein